MILCRTLHGVQKFAPLLCGSRSGARCGKALASWISLSERKQTDRSKQVLRVSGCSTPLGLRSWLKRCLGWTPPAPALPAWLDDAFARRTNLPERWRAFHAPQALPTTLHAESYNILCSPLWSCTFERQDPGFTACPLAYRPAGSWTDAVDTCSGRNPGFDAESLMKLRASNPAPPRSISGRRCG